MYTSEYDDNARSLRTARVFSSAHSADAPHDRLVNCVEGGCCEHYGDRSSNGGICTQHIDGWHHDRSKCVHCDAALKKPNLYRMYQDAKGAPMCPLHHLELRVGAAPDAFQMQHSCVDCDTGRHYCLDGKREFLCHWQRPPWRFTAHAHAAGRDMLAAAGQAQQTSGVARAITAWLKETAMYASFHLCRGDQCRCDGEHRADSGFAHGAYARLTADLLLARDRLGA